MKVVVDATASERNAARQILGVSVLGRILNELFLLGAEQITVVSDAPSGAGDGLSKELARGAALCWVQVPPGADLDVILDAIDGRGSELLVVPADVVASRAFLSAALRHPVGPGTAAVFSPAERAEPGSGRIRKLAPGGARAIASGQVQSVELDGFCSRVCERSSAKRARRILLDQLRKPIEIDGLLGYTIMRPITLRVTRFLASTPLRPNHLTALTALVGLAGVALVAFGDAGLAVAGAGLFFLACYFDCLDGELARIKYQTSYLGAFLDTISDDVQTLLFIGAVGWYLQRTGQGWLHVGLAAASMLVFALAQLYIYFRLHTGVHSGDLLDFEWAFEKRARAPKERSLLPLVKYVIKRDFYTALFFVLFSAGLPRAVSFLLAVFTLGYAVAIIVHVAMEREWLRSDSRVEASSCIQERSA
ncbi:MAG: CDP-alcohol phosphatidyltransferase family protein [Deltaproteobacteria bacterium]|nr:CDP-alcohol phosphatidyltransferase family protein [Deltaproteobacteria bacterium]